MKSPEHCKAQGCAVQTRFC